MAFQLGNVMDKCKNYLHTLVGKCYVDFPLTGAPKTGKVIINHANLCNPAAGLCFGLTPHPFTNCCVCEDDRIYKCLIIVRARH